MSVSVRPFHRNQHLPPHRICDLAAVFVLIVLIALVALTFADYAITNDEEVQHRYGELIVSYYQSGFADRRLFDFGNLYLYGGLFDIVAVLLAKLIPFEPYALRHILSALCGIGGVAATWAAARLVGGPRAGLLAALLLAVCGPWYGTMFNHTKDIPFAAAMIGATYFLLCMGRDLPRPRAGHVIGFGLLLGAALGLRALGLLLVGYAGLIVLSQLVLTGTDNWRARALFIVRSMLALLPALILGYVIMIAAWPWSALELLNPVRAIFAFAHFSYGIRTVIDGTVYDMSKVPRWYVVAYLAIKLPLFMLAAVVPALFLAFWPRVAADNTARRKRIETASIAFTAIFPLLCQAIGHGPEFTGLRHFLFVVPPLAVLAGVGLDATLAGLARYGRPAVPAGAAAIAVTLTWYATTLVRLHPYEYLFYNPLVGGLEGASRRYVTDYWVTIMPEAVAALEAHIARLRRSTPGLPPHSYRVAVCGEKLPFEKTVHPDLQWTDDWDHADFFIAPTHMNCDRALDGKVVVDIKRTGALVGVVKDRRDIIHRDVAHHP